MLQLPHSQHEWVVAIASALAGFFFGGAAIAVTQRSLKKWFGIGR